ncbi:hypothetical protein Q31b_36670 [Novipirellula aureliae]|uniref:Uncharacterized protein n=2 Tax=Novipirellula aureliae TaxID=2527966 RepID=A0A5C6DZJ2_9BACT|nr:hypothetical protein Q31b_36670 [Novipirellula aureliae]
MRLKGKSVGVAFSVFALQLCLLTTSAEAADLSGVSVSGVSVSGVSVSGVSVRFDPARVQPGDVCALIVEMDRETFGGFELHVPSHPNLHLVSIERFPVSLKDGRYQQRQCWWLQPLASGTVVISDVQVELTDSNGTETIALPSVTLDVVPLESMDLSDAPEPLPPAVDDHDATSLGIRYLTVFLTGLLLLVAAALYRKRPRTSMASGDVQWDPMVDAVEQLQSGSVPLHLLEQILAHRGGDLSPQLRCEIEQSVYGKRREPAVLLDLLREETMQ